MSKHHKKEKQYSNRLQVWQSFACLVAENVKVDEDEYEYLVKGSSIFCGCCGASVGQLKSDLHFPFSYNSLKSSLLNIGFRGKEFLQCTKCQQTLFDDVLKMVITRMDNFLDLQKKAISERIVSDFGSGKLKEEVIQKTDESKQVTATKTKLRVQK